MGYVWVGGYCSRSSRALKSGLRSRLAKDIVVNLGLGIDPVAREGSLALYAESHRLVCERAGGTCSSMQMRRMSCSAIITKESFLKTR